MLSTTPTANPLEYFGVVGPETPRKLRRHPGQILPLGNRWPGVATRLVPGGSLLNQIRGISYPTAVGRSIPGPSEGFFVGGLCFQEPVETAVGAAAWSRSKVRRSPLASR